MKHTTFILLVLLLWSPLVLNAQSNSLGTIGTAPAVINTGFDDESNQVYIIWDQPVRKVDPATPADGFTLFINNVQRPIVNNGGEVSILATESYISPVGIDIKPTDTVKISYNAGSNPIIGRDSALRATPLSVVEVTNGLNRDTTCPQLQTRLVKLDPTRNLFITYFNERMKRGETAFTDYSTLNTIQIGTQLVTSDISIAIASSIATRALEPKTIDWSQPISITIDETTSITDTVGNRACPGTTLIHPSTAQPNTQQPLPTATTPNIPNQTPTVSEQPPIGPQIVSFNIIESITPKAGNTLKITSTTDIPVDAKSTLLIELNNGKRKVSLRPTQDGSTTLVGTVFITQNMISQTPLKVSSIISSKLIDNAKPDTINTSTQSPLTNPQSTNFTDSNLPQNLIITQ